MAAAYRQAACRRKARWTPGIDFDVLEDWHRVWRVAAARASAGFQRLYLSLAQGCPDEVLFLRLVRI